jgi:hypothetical protein
MKMTADNSIAPGGAQTQDRQSHEERFACQWLSNLMGVLDGNLDRARCAQVMKGCALVHYRDMNMDAIVSQYKGDLKGFCSFLSETWKWKVDYDEASQIITADEGKNECVCPLVKCNVIRDSSILCYCSEGFAEKMFSSVVGRAVEARVVQSILRGSKSCVYAIQIFPDGHEQ